MKSPHFKEAFTKATPVEHEGGISDGWGGNSIKSVETLKIRSTDPYTTIKPVLC